MSEEPNDLEQRRIQAATKAMGATSRKMQQVIAETPRPNGLEEGINALLRELHRRGLPEHVTFSLLTWPVGLLTYVTAAMLETGIVRENMVDAIDLILDSRDAGDYVDDTIEKLVAVYDIDCACGYAECPRGFYKLAQISHGVITACDALLGLIEIDIGDFERFEKTQDGPYVEKIASAKSCLEFLAMFVINAEMPQLFG